MAAKWRVVSQRQTEQLTSAGTFEQVVMVTYETGNGTIGTVTIPSRLYTPEYVRDQVDAAANTTIAVENLQA